MNKKQANAKQRHLLWVDLEMTGLDPVKDHILEVAAIVTDWQFNEIATYQAAVKVRPNIMNRRMQKGPAAAFWQSVPATRDALIAQNATARPLKSVEADLLVFLDSHFIKDLPVVLAGNSIHMDRKFIDSWWPQLAQRLHYRMLDVSAWKLVFEHSFKKKFAKREAHRALDDIRGSIEELQYYLKRVKS